MEATAAFIEKSELSRSQKLTSEATTASSMASALASAFEGINKIETLRIRIHVVSCFLRILSLASLDFLAQVNVFWLFFTEFYLTLLIQPIIT